MVTFVDLRDERGAERYDRRMVGRFLGWTFVVTALAAGCSGRSSTSAKPAPASGGSSAQGGSGGSGGNEVGGSTTGVGGAGAAGGATGGSVSKGGTAGVAGGPSCIAPMIACKDCKGAPLPPDCVNGNWTCPDLPCEEPGVGGSAGTQGVAGTSGAGGDAEGGSSGDPLDEVNAACRSFCKGWELACPGNAPASADCAADCIAGNEELPESCASAQAAYLMCAITPDDCSADRTLTPAGCSDEQSALTECLLGDIPLSCIRGFPQAGFDGCFVVTTCGVTQYTVECDAEDDGTGTSLCDCTKDGVHTLSVSARGIGPLACAQAAEACGP